MRQSSTTPSWRLHRITRYLEPASQASDTNGHRWQRSLLLAVVALTLLVGGGHLAGAWYFSSQIDARALSAEARRASLIPTYSVEVVAVDGSTITLRKDGEKRLDREGTWGVAWEGGWGIISTPVRPNAATPMKWTVETVEGDLPAPGTLVDLDSRVYAGDPLTGLGIAFETITYDGDRGTLSAWFVRGQSSTWFIFVHGNGLTRRDGLRTLPTVVELGLPALLVTYRGDEGAPDPDRRLTYGKDEWHDLEAAVDFARAHGAERIILSGVSMGGAVITAFLLESPLAQFVDGVVLDAPVLNFERAVEHRAKGERIPFVGLPLPGTLIGAAEWLAEVRYGIDWGYTDYLARVDQLAVPVLLIHGTDDGTVPLSTSEDFAQKRPDLVRDFYVVEGAGHVESWNANPDEYERRLRAFLEGILGPVVD